jgi:hypothetical protein
MFSAEITEAWRQEAAEKIAPRFCGSEVAKG